MGVAQVFRSIAAMSYFNAALGTGAVAVTAGSLSTVRNASDLGTPGARYPTHCRVTNSHATQYVGALVADSGDVALTSTNFTCVVPPLSSLIMPLTPAMRVSVIASAANTMVSVEFGTIS